ncbi:unnamed protein product [Pieris brassicae]|uniref:Uncharacterized protein n=1 Tax=Pieris brassicae TaxID=7116 RepID=A0A9P0T9V4_PIEBR|nr:unnamed protein product [Pieris brassicae]
MRNELGPKSSAHGHAVQLQPEQNAGVRWCLRSNVKRNPGDCQTFGLPYATCMTETEMDALLALRLSRYSRLRQLTHTSSYNHQKRSNNLIHA